MNRIVVDASLALAWAFPDETDGYAQTVLKSLTSRSIIVPGHWALEVTNAILMAERKGRITRSDSTRIIAFFAGLPIRVDEHAAALATSTTLSLARDYGLTAYDAAYLEVGIREGIALASLDSHLIGAYRAAGGQLA